MAEKYKLTYFDVEALAEAIRFLFHYGNIEFEDERISREQWPELKQNTPFGTIPVLTYNGKKVGQSLAIARYLAKQVKLTGSNDWEDLEIDSIVDTFTDWRIKMSKYHAEKDEEIKTKQKPEIDQYNEFMMNKFEEVVSKNNGYLALGRLTWADIIFASFATYMTTTLDKYPNLIALNEKVFAIPNIKKWIEQRPAYKFP